MFGVNNAVKFTYKRRCSMGFFSKSIYPTP